MNGVIVVPIMIALMIVGSNKRQMGKFTATAGQRIFGWGATVMMTVAAVAMFVLM